MPVLDLLEQPFNVVEALVVRRVILGMGHRSLPRCALLDRRALAKRTLR